MATLKEVATAAGVHPATASRALNEETRHLVNARTVARIETTARELGYTANPIARSLRKSRSETIGVVLPDLTNPLFPPIVRGIEDAMRAVGYVPWIVNTDNDPDRERTAVTSFRMRRVEGLVLATARLTHPLLAELAATRTPIVLVNRRIDNPPISSVTADDESGITAAVEHLHGLGHREIVHLAGPQDTSTGRNRRRAFRRAMAELDLPTTPGQETECRSWSIGAGAAAIEDLLRRGSRFSAAVAGNDLIALGAIEALAAAGLHCPDDVSVTGFNDIPLMDKVSPPLTTLSLPHYEIGREAARLLLELIDEPDRAARSVLLPTSLVVRGSTGPAPR